MSYISKTKSLSPATKSFREQLLWGGTCRFLVAIFPLLKALRLKKNWKVLCRCEVSHETNIDLLISYNLQLTLRREGLLILVHPASRTKILGRFPFTPSIGVEILGVNIQCCSFSRRKIIEMGRSENVLVSIGNCKRKRKNALIKSIAYNF